MDDIDTIIADVRRLRVDENEDDAPECSMCGDTYQLRDGCYKTAVCDLCAQRIAEEYAPYLARACEEQRGEIERLRRELAAAEESARMYAERGAKWQREADQARRELGEVREAAQALVDATDTCDREASSRSSAPLVRYFNAMSRLRAALGKEQGNE